MQRIELIGLLLLAFVLTACPTQKPPAPKISSFTATPASLPAGGGDVTLAWSVSDAEKLSIEPGVGEVSGSQTTVRVSQSTTFTLTATGPGGSDSKTASVSVAAPAEPSIEVSPTSVKLRAGDPAQTFTATVRNSSASVSWSLGGPGSLSATSGTSTQYTPPATLSGPASATLTASLSGTGKTAQADIALSPPPGWAQLGDRLNEGYRGSWGIGAGTVPIALDSSGNPWVAFHQMSGQVNNVFVRHWNGSAWQTLGSALNNDTAKNAFNPAMALPASGNPVVAFTETTTSSGSDTDNLYVKRWNPGSGKWETLGDLLNNPGKGVQESALALDGDGNPVVVWREQASFYVAILVKRWNPSLEKWEALGTSPVASGVIAGSLGVVVDSANHPVVAWHEPLTINRFGVKAARFEGNTWKALGSLLNVSPGASAALPALALDKDRVPVVAWSENTAEGNRVFVKRWNETAGGWEGLGSGLAASPRHLALALDGDGNPWVAVEQYSVSVHHQVGNNWFPLGGDLGNSSGSAGFVALALDGGGNPVLAFDEFADPPGDRPWNVYVKRYNP